jgi:hypothetical protein
MVIRPSRRSTKTAEVVFAGTVTAATPEPPANRPFDLDGTTYTLTVDETFRGRLPKTVRIFSENSRGRFPMEIGAKYLLFASTWHGRVIVDNCGNSERLNPDSRTLTIVRSVAAAR